MAVSPSLKIASVAIGAGGIVTGGAVGVHNYLSKSNEEGKKEDSALSSERITTDTVPTEKPITTLLSEEKFKLLEKNSTGDGEWKNKWTTFKEKYTDSEPQGNWSFTNWTDLKSSENAPVAFQDKCIANGSKEMPNKDAPLYAEVKENCAVKSPG